MCFSPEASFTASAVIATVGVISFKKSKDYPTKILACIPIFFGIQQFFEGFVWLSLLYERYAFFQHISTSGFMVFAWIVWPIWVPYSMMLIEHNLKRKAVIKLFMYLGFFVSAMLTYTLAFGNVDADILDCSIIYNFDAKQSLHLVFSVLYLMVTVLPTLICRVSKTWLLGVMNILAYAGTKLFISDRILSIWCFFAATTSAIVLWIIIDYNNNKLDSTVRDS